MRKDNNGWTQVNVHHLCFHNNRLLQIIAVFSVCILCFVLGMWQNTTSVIFPQKSSCRSFSEMNSVSISLDFGTHHTLAMDDIQNISVKFDPCDIKFSEYTPCHDDQRSQKFDRNMLVFRERHCPKKDEMLNCLIPAPVGYKNPFPWPQSRDYAWFSNVPHKELTIKKAVQKWVEVQGDKLHFPGGGTTFPQGADAYIQNIDSLLSLTKGTIRTAIDTGCGVASWGAYLMSRNIITMSIAPRDTHEAQVQFALERGVPAMIGIMATHRLPYPARAFDMGHCSRCLIPWHKYDGLYLIEMDRILRPGGYWILSGPPINWKTHHRGWQRTVEDLQQEQHEIEDVAKRLCWKKLVEKDDIAIWQKPTNHINCRNSRRVIKFPPMCHDNNNSDSAWYQKMEACITPLPEFNSSSLKMKEVAGGALETWPHRLTALPPRIGEGSLAHITPKQFNEDTQMWNSRVAYYKRIIGAFAQGRYRNIMDMNAYMAGFSAALANDPVWVMNVVPTHHSSSSSIVDDTLGVIYERGLIGTYHDWCEAFSTYPRTYDLIHAHGLISMYENRCDLTHVLLEMDRILRPEGAVIFRDDVDVLIKVKSLTDGMRWKAQIANTEKGPFDANKILIAVKQYWTASGSSKK